MEDGNHALHQLRCESEPELLKIGMQSLDFLRQDHLVGSTNTGTNFQKRVLSSLSWSAVSLTKP